jgi:hypothetical protein
MSSFADVERQEHARTVEIGPPLDLHEGIRTLQAIDPVRGGCGRWPEIMRLVNKSTGELVRGRCHSTNLCLYCAKLFAVETSEMLALDAVEDAPSIYSVLTAREHLTRSDCTTHLRHCRRTLRRSWPDVRWATTVEFQRRGALHLNLMTKGVPVGELEGFHSDLSDTWCSRVDAELAGQWSDAIADAVGVVQYISLHFMKSSQAPAIGWKGHRFSCMRDYLVRPAAMMRVEARRSLALKRAIYRGMDADVAALEVAAAELVEWDIVNYRPSRLIAEVVAERRAVKVDV